MESCCSLNPWLQNRLKSLVTILLVDNVKTTSPSLKKQEEVYISRMLKAEIEATDPPATPYKIALYRLEMIFLSAGITFLIYSSICTPRITFQCEEMVKLIVLISPSTRNKSC